MRVIEKDGEPWFVAKDVCDVLGYVNPRQTVATHCKATSTVTIHDGRQMRNMTIIPERDVYRLIMRSKLPSAEKFEEWVVGEVLPTIRKTGSYSVPQQPKSSAEMLLMFAQQMVEQEQLQKWKS